MIKEKDLLEAIKDLLKSLVLAEHVGDVQNSMWTFCEITDIPYPSKKDEDYNEGED